MVSFCLFFFNFKHHKFSLNCLQLFPCQLHIQCRRDTRSTLLSNYFSHHMRLNIYNVGALPAICLAQPKLPLPVLYQKQFTALGHWYSWPCVILITRLKPSSVSPIDKSPAGHFVPCGLFTGILGISKEIPSLGPKVTNTRKSLTPMEANLATITFPEEYSITNQKKGHQHHWPSRNWNMS